MRAESHFRECLQKLRTQTDKVLALLSVDGDRPKRISELIEAGRAAGIPEIRQWNISALLAAAKGQVIRLPNGWILTSEGQRHVAQSIDTRPSVKSKSTHGLAGYALRIKNEETRAFIDEAIACYDAGHLRAAAVLAWVGAMAVLYDHVVNEKLSEFNAQAALRDSKWRFAKNADGLARMKEREFLEMLELIGVIGKNVKQELQNNCLELRNSCGHPNSFKVGEHRVASHIETLIQNVFCRFTSRT